MPSSDHAFAAQVSCQLPAAVEWMLEAQPVQAAHQRQVVRALSQRLVVLRGTAHAQQRALPGQRQPAAAVHQRGTLRTAQRSNPRRRQSNTRYAWAPTVSSPSFACRFRSSRAPTQSEYTLSPPSDCPTNQDHLTARSSGPRFSYTRTRGYRMGARHGPMRGGEMWNGGARPRAAPLHSDGRAHATFLQPDWPAPRCLRLPSAARRRGAGSGGGDRQSIERGSTRPAVSRRRQDSSPSNSSDKLRSNSRRQPRHMLRSSCCDGEGAASSGVGMVGSSG